MNHTYKWIEDWVTIPESPLSTSNGRTHGIVESKAGLIYLFHQAVPSVVVYDADGVFQKSWGNFPGAHGMTLVEEHGVEYLWLTDQDTQKVVKTTLDGEELLELHRPDHPLYAEKPYVPTWVAVNEERHGGNGDLWVTDGYGSHLIHRYDKQGNYLTSIDGTEGPAGLFECPHGIWIGPRQGAQQLYIADRTNKRIQVYDTEGNFLRVFGNDFLTSPDMFFPCGEYLIIPELEARLTILDGNDQPVARFGVNDEVSAREGWPNNRDLVEEGKFNSPHGACADAKGNLFVVEWITGGRVTKLEKQE